MYEKEKEYLHYNPLVLDSSFIMKSSQEQELKLKRLNSSLSLESAISPLG